MAEIICKVRDIHKDFAAKQVLKGISFDLCKGEIIGIIGKSGSGKSTLMNIIAGILKPTQGSITFTQKDLSTKKLKELIGYSFQPFSLYEELTVEENIIYFGSLYGFGKNESLERAKKLFVMTDLSADDLPLLVRDLSGGMKKRFDIVLSLLHGPKILLLDEPTAGLDPLRRKDIIRIMKKICSEGVTVLISSHIMSDLEDVCNRVLVIHDGKKLIMDDIERVKFEILDSELIKLKTLPGNYDKLISHIKAFRIMECEVKDSWLLIYTPETEIIVFYILHLLDQFNETLDRLIIAEPDLGEVFEKLQSKTPEKIMKMHVLQLKTFIDSMIGKKIPEEKIKEILRSNKWPREIADAVVSREVRVAQYRR